MKAILFLSILALSLLLVQTKEQFQKNRLASKLAQFHPNLTRANSWPIHGGHGPVITNFTKNLTHHKMADDESGDELWAWPEVRRNRPAVTNFTKNLFSAVPRPRIAIKPAVKTASLTQNLTNLKKADDEFWSWPKFGGHGPVVVNSSRINGTHWPKFAGHGPVITNFTRNLTNLKKADDESNDELWSWPSITKHASAVTNFTKILLPKNLSAVQTDDELWSWPKFGGHGPVVTNFTHNLINSTKADDELWSWPKFGGIGPVVIKNKTELQAPKNKTQGKFLSF